MSKIRSIQVDGKENAIRVAFPIELFSESDGTSEFKEMHVVPTGKWDHPVYGEMEITETHISEFVHNFNAGVRRDIPITAGHDNGMSGGELPAIGWFKELVNRGAEGLWAFVEWTEEGRKLLSDRSFKYFSPEFYEQYEDPETRKRYSHVLVGGALTNKPYFKELAPVAAFSEPKIIYQFSDNSMDLQQLLAKKVEELSEEERAFVKEHKAELTAEQLDAFKTVVEDTPAPEADPSENAGGEAEEGAPEEAQAPIEAQPEGGEAEEGAPAPVSASERVVTLSEKEVNTLRENAEKGAKALSELNKIKLGEIVSKLVFSEANKEGRLLPKQKDSVLAFMETLSDNQRAAFVEIVSKGAKITKLFTEIGDGKQDTASSAKAQFDAKITAEMKANGKLSYSEALLKVQKENPALKQAYEAELESQD